MSKESELKKKLDAIARKIQQPSPSTQKPSNIMIKSANVGEMTVNSKLLQYSLREEETEDKKLPKE